MKESIGLSDLIARIIHKIEITNPIAAIIHKLTPKFIWLPRWAKYAVNQNHRARPNAIIQ